MTENKTNCMRVITQLIGTIIFIVIFPCLVSSTEIKAILIVSIDALHPDALGSKTTKTIHNLMKQGVFTLDGKSTDPPLTLLGHAAIFSGIGPQKSGRKNNKWYSGQPVINDKTIFYDAKLPLAMIFDVADLGQYQRIKYHVTKLRSILEKIVNFQKDIR